MSGVSPRITRTSPLSSGVLRCGEVFKASTGQITRWQSRVQTQTRSGKLSYRHNVNDPPVFIPLDSNSIARVVQKPSAAAPGPVFTQMSGRVAGSSSVSEREFQLACRTREERDAWVEALNSAIRDSFPLSYDSPLVLEDAQRHRITKSDYMMVREPGAAKWSRTWVAVNALACCIYANEKDSVPIRVCSFTPATTVNAEENSTFPGKCVFSVSATDDDKLFLFATSSRAECELWIDAIQSALRSQEERQLFDLAKNKGVPMSQSTSSAMHPRAQERMLETALTSGGDQYNTVAGMSELNYLTLHQRRAPVQSSGAIDEHLLTAMKTSLQTQKDYSRSLVPSKDIRAPSVDQSRAMARHSVAMGTDDSVQLTINGKHNPQLLSDVHALTITGNSASRMPLTSRSKTYNAGNDFPTLTAQQRTVLGADPAFAVYHSQPPTELAELPPVSVDDQRYTHSQVAAAFCNAYIGKSSKFNPSLPKQRLFVVISGQYMYFFTQKSHTSPHAYATGIRPAHCAMLRGARVSVVDLTISVHPVVPTKPTGPGVVSAESLMAITLENAEDCSIWFKHLIKASGCYDGPRSSSYVTNGGDDSKRDDVTGSSRKIEEKVTLTDLFQNNDEDAIIAGEAIPAATPDDNEAGSTVTQGSTVNTELQLSKNTLSEQIKKMLESSSSSSNLNMSTLQIAGLPPMMPPFNANTSNSSLANSVSQEHILSPLHPSSSTLSHEMLELQLMQLQQQLNMQQLQLQGHAIIPPVSVTTNAPTTTTMPKAISPLNPITPLNMIVPLYNQQQQQQSSVKPLSSGSNSLVLPNLIAGSIILTPSSSGGGGSMSNTPVEVYSIPQLSNFHPPPAPLQPIVIPPPQTTTTAQIPNSASTPSQAAAQLSMSGRLSLNLKDVHGSGSSHEPTVPESWNAVKPVDPMLAGLQTQFDIEEEPLFKEEVKQTRSRTSTDAAASSPPNMTSPELYSTANSPVQRSKLGDVSETASSTATSPVSPDAWDHLESPKTLQILVAEQSVRVSETLSAAGSYSETSFVDGANSFESFAQLGKRRAQVYVTVGPSVCGTSFYLRVYNKKPSVLGPRVGNSALTQNIKERYSYSLEGVSFALSMCSGAYGAEILCLNGEEVILGFESAFCRNKLFKALTEASVAVSFIEIPRHVRELSSHVIGLASYAYVLTSANQWQRTFLVARTKPSALVAYTSHIHYEDNPSEAISHIWLDQAQIEPISLEMFELPYVFRVEMEGNTVFVRFTNAKLFRKWGDTLLHPGL